MTPEKGRRKWREKKRDRDHKAGQDWLAARQGGKGKEKKKKKKKNNISNIGKEKTGTPQRGILQRNRLTSEGGRNIRVGVKTERPLHPMTYKSVIMVG